MNDQPHAAPHQSPPASSFFRRAITTPARDWIRGRLSGRLDWRTVIHRADLPEPVNALMTLVVKRSRLWRLEKTDLASELITHFADGLAAGHEPETLVQNFGDPRNASTLIRRAKKRSRHWLCRAFVHASHGLLAILLAIVCVYGLLAWRYYSGKPTITRNFAAEYNKTIEQIPEKDSAWDLYVQIYALLGNEPDFPVKVRHNQTINAWPYIDFNGPFYPKALAYLQTHQDALTLIRKAAAKPHLGTKLSDAVDPRIIQIDQERNHTSAYTDKPSANPMLIHTQLPAMSFLRQANRLMIFDAHVAASKGQPNRIMQDIQAMLGIAHQAAEDPFLISNLVGISIYAGTIHTTAQIMHEYPDLLDDAQLQELSHRFAAFMGGTIRVDLTAERWTFEDTIQRIYTDDGHGNGHITATGIRNLENMLGIVESGLYQDTPAPFAPIAAAIIANRKDMMAKYNQLMAETQYAATLPMWEYDQRNDADSELNMLEANPITRTRYLPITILMPAPSQAQQVTEKVTQERDGLLTGIALELYKREHGRYPDSLDALVPVYLPTVPPDRFTGTPIYYAIIDGQPRLWSVGVDRNNDNGKPPAKKHGYESRWLPRDQAQQNEQNDPDNYDGDWVLWPMVYEPITGKPKD